MEYLDRDRVVGIRGEEEIFQRVRDINDIRRRGGRRRDDGLSGFDLTGQLNLHNLWHNGRTNIRPYTSISQRPYRAGRRNKSLPHFIILLFEGRKG